MKINVSKELKAPGKAVTHRFESGMKEFHYMGRDTLLASPIQVDAECLFDGDAFSVKGRLTTAFDTECALCGKQVIEPIAIEFDERFTREAGEEDESFLFQGEELDFSQMILSNILLSANYYSLCSEDCKGLCPACGCDLNLVQCSCVIEHEGEKSNTPLSMLSALLNDDKEV